MDGGLGENEKKKLKVEPTKWRDCGVGFGDIPTVDFCIPAPCVPSATPPAQDVPPALSLWWLAIPLAFTVSLAFAVRLALAVRLTLTVVSPSPSVLPSPSVSPSFRVPPVVAAVLATATMDTVLVLAPSWILEALAAASSAISAKNAIGIYPSGTDSELNTIKKPRRTFLTGYLENHVTSIAPCIGGTMRQPYATTRQPEHRPRERRVDHTTRLAIPPTLPPAVPPTLSSGPFRLFLLGTRHDSLVRAHVGPGPGVGAGMGYKHDQEAEHDPMHDTSTAYTMHRLRAHHVHDASPVCMTRRPHARRITCAHDASLYGLLLRSGEGGSGGV
ncbi:hypothetical protein BJV77DRAFT_1072454 [Russula vinacea]|nr:hypothetical protein BJV77DRAFT_1072454 [Russula vinacea]